MDFGGQISRDYGPDVARFDAKKTLARFDAKKTLRKAQAVRL